MRLRFTALFRAGATVAVVSAALTTFAAGPGVTVHSATLSPLLTNHVFALQATPPAAQRTGLMSDQVFKNVQVLKGIPVDDFMQSMGLMSAALGFDCDSCHTRAGTDQVKWEEDSPNKRTARRMVSMVMAINRENFGGRQMITCWTCHRGRDLPLVTPSLDAWYGETNEELDDVVAATPGGPTTDQILDKYLKAVGGAQPLARLKSFVAKGKSVGFGGFGGGGLVQIFAQAPDKRATYIQFPDDPSRGDSIRTFDGRTGWLTNPYAVVPKYELSGSELDGAMLDAQLSFPAQIKQVLTNLHVGPSATIKEKKVQLVQGSGPRGMLVTLYFEQESGLLVRIVRYGRSPIGRLPTQIDYSEYREVGGIKFPSHSTFSWLDGRDNFDLTDIQINVSIDPLKFGEPKTLH